MEVKENIYHGVSEFQTIDILDTFEYGRMLLLDDIVMLTERDEFVYHEMLAHVPLNTHRSPKRVLVIGGGDGGTVREVLKYPQIEEITLVEIDRMVVEASLTHLPGISVGLQDPRTRIVYGDGVRFVADTKPESYDVILIDSTDPVGPAEALFAEAFFHNCARVLSPDGIMVSQSESPFYHLPFMVDVHRLMKNVYPEVGFYLAAVPTYPSGSWSFLMGSKEVDTLLPVCHEHGKLSTRYYDGQVHLASFVLPRFLAQALDK